MKDEQKIKHHLKLLRRAIGHVEEQIDLLSTALAVEEAKDECDEYGGEPEIGPNYSGLVEKG